MRFTCVLLLLAALSACNRGGQSKDAVRQGVLDHLSGMKFNLESMSVDVTNVTFNGNQADASVTFSAKSVPGAGMNKIYHLEQQGAKWVVTGSKDSGGAPHSGMMPAGGGTENRHGGGSENPHGAATAPGPGVASPHASVPGMSGGSGKMPSPEDLPPTGKKK